MNAPSSQTVIKSFVLYSTVTMLGACTTISQPKPIETMIEPGKAVYKTASLSDTYIRMPNDEVIICTQSAPDATFDQSEGFNLSIALVNTGTTDSGGGDGDDEEMEMAGRTPALLMTRELFFRACEFSGNYNLSKQEASNIYMKTLDTVSNVWAKEAENTTITIGDTVKDNEGVTISASDAINAISASSSSSSSSSSDSDDDSSY